MKVKAIKSFAGAVTMKKGDQREIEDEMVLEDLLNCGYVEKVTVAKKTTKKKGE